MEPIFTPPLAERPTSELFTVLAMNRNTTGMLREIPATCSGDLVLTGYLKVAELLEAELLARGEALPA